MSSWDSVEFHWAVESKVGVNIKVQCGPREVSFYTFSFAVYVFYLGVVQRTYTFRKQKIC